MDKSHPLVINVSTWTKLSGEFCCPPLGYPLLFTKGGQGIVSIMMQSGKAEFWLTEGGELKEQVWIEGF